MKIKELLKDPRNWTQGASARDYFDNSILPTSFRACKWCLIGAAYVCYPEANDYNDVITRITRYINNVNLTSHINLTSWNDVSSRKHQEVLDLCNKLDV